MADLDDLLRRQDLVLTRAQALDKGLTKHAWDYRLTTFWQALLDGVAVTHTGGLTQGQRLWAAVLHAGPGARLSGDAALALLGHPVQAEGIDVAIPHHRRVQDTELVDGTAVRIRRVRHLELLHGPVVGIPMLTRHVAALHAASWADTDRAAEWRIAAMVQQRLSAVPLLRKALELQPRLRRRPLIRTVLDDVELGAHAASELEFLRFLRRNGLPLPDELQRRVRTSGGPAYLDARYRKQRVTFEIDGAHHREAGSWEADALRSLRVGVALSGERVFRLTTANLRHDEQEVAALLHTILVLGKDHPVGAG